MMTANRGVILRISLLLITEANLLSIAIEITDAFFHPLGSGCAFEVMVEELLHTQKDRR